jgi:hypothetical protein
MFLELMRWHVTKHRSLGVQTHLGINHAAVWKAGKSTHTLCFVFEADDITIISRLERLLERTLVVVLGTLEHLGE